MSVWYYLGVAAGLTVGAIVALVVWLTRRSAGKRGKYDERQVAARGRAHRAGFITVLVYEFAYAILDFLGLKWCVNATGIILGLCLGVTVFAVVAILEDAYLSLNDNLRSWCITSGLITAANLLIGLRYLFQGGLIENGMLTSNWMNLFIAMMFGTILITQLIHSARREREETEE